MSIRESPHRLLTIVFLAVLSFGVLAGAAIAESPLAGSYTADGKTADGLAYGGQVGIESQGKGVILAWVLDGGAYRGLGLQLDHVLGAVYWADREQFADPGIVVYRIDGGRLQGVWMPQGGSPNLIGREDLLGPDSLEGRFEITLGQNPGGQSRYTGHVDIERNGDGYHFHWYAPRDSYIGNGIRIGNIMVVGYALHRAPGTAAYCIHGADLDGQWAYGEDARLGRESLHRQSGAASPPPAAGNALACVPTVALD